MPLDDNHFVTPGTSDVQSVVDILSTSVTGDAVIAAGFSPTQNGAIARCTTSLWLEGSFVQAKQVITKSQLRKFTARELFILILTFIGHGDSGSVCNISVLILIVALAILACSC